MKKFHHVTINVFIKPEDDALYVKEVFFDLFPFNLEKNKVRVTETVADSFFDRKVIIIEVFVDKPRLVAEVMSRLRDCVTESDRALLVSQVDSRLDEDLYFFFRFDKKLLLEEGMYKVVDHGNCFHVKCSVAVYPKNRDKAKQALIDFLS